MEDNNKTPGPAQADQFGQPTSNVSFGAVNPNKPTRDQQRLIPARVMPDGSSTFTETNIQNPQFLANATTTGSDLTVFTSKARYSDCSVVCTNLDTVVQALTVYVVPSGQSAATKNKIIPGYSIAALSGVDIFDFGMNPGDAVVVNGANAKFSVNVSGKLSR